MKTAKILKKSVLNPRNNWITLLNSANLSKKNAVTPVNFHLYHYASNNPVRYTDPTGLFSIDEENHTITCDWNDTEDLKAAYKAFKKDKSIEKCIIKDDAYSVVISNREDMRRIVVSDRLTKNVLPVVEFISAVTPDIISTIQVYKRYNQLAPFSYVFSYFSIKSDILSARTAIDEGDMVRGVLYSIDAVFDVVGLAGTNGYLINCVYRCVKYSIQGTIYGIKELARGAVYCERQIVNQCCRSVTGKNWMRFDK